MKTRKILLLCLTPVLLACTTNSPSSSSLSSAIASSTPAASESSVPSSSASESSAAASGEKYLFYQLKEGATKDGLEGAPWVNSVKEGVAAKLIKPSHKDDFYLNKTYQMQINAKLEEGDIAIGGVPGAIKTMSKRTTKMLTEKTSSSFSDALRGIYALYTKEDKSAEIAYVKGIIDEIKAINSLSAMADYLYNKAYDFVWPLFELVRPVDDKILLAENHLGLTASSLNYSYLYDQSQKQRVIDSTVYLLGLYGYREDESKALLDNATTAYKDATEGGFDKEVVTINGIDEKYPNLRLKDYLSTKLGYALTTEVSIEGNISRLLSAISASGSQAEGGRYALSLDAIKNILILRLAFASAIARPIAGENGFMALTDGLNSNTQGFNEDMFVKDIFSTYFNKAYDRLYIDNYETKERRASIVSFMKEVASEYKVLLQESEWLDQSTRQAAVRKLDAMKFDACYPVSLESLPAWNYTVPTTFMQAANDYSAWSRLASQPANANHYLWAGTITTVNGVYDSYTNAFVVYDGLLASDSFAANMSKEELYGSIGAAIGHEISHAFDVKGSNYDEYGQRNNWWTDKDRTTYNAKVDKIKQVWSQYENKPNMKLSCDDDMLSEIIADMGGVSVCLRLGAKQEGFDYDKFFTSFADMHGTIMSQAALENLVYGAMSGKQDSHPLSVFRVNGVVNQFEQFYKTYSVSENDKMYVAPADRLNIWG